MSTEDHTDTKIDIQKCEDDACKQAAWCYQVKGNGRKEKQAGEHDNFRGRRQRLEMQHGEELNTAAFTCANCRPLIVQG